MVDKLWHVHIKQYSAAIREDEVIHVNKYLQAISKFQIFL